MWLFSEDIFIVLQAFYRYFLLEMCAPTARAGMVLGRLICNITIPRLFSHDIMLLKT